MSRDVRQMCIVCAWRANCAKRFSLGPDATMHCPDFTEDITLRKPVPEAQDEPPEEH